MRAASPSQPDSDLIEHERTYKIFNVLLRWCMVHLASVIVGLTLWFATSAGFLGGLFGGLAVFGLGYIFLVRHEEHQPLDPWAEGR
jgi:hypothetical protein